VPPRRQRRARATNPPSRYPVSQPDGEVALALAEPEPSALTSLNAPPRLTELLDSLSEPPPYAALLGVCEDGLPFLLDLTNPAPGSILSIGDRAAGKTALICSLLHSVCRLNSPDQISFHVVARQPAEYLALEQMEHCQATLSVGEPAVADLIAELVATAETRKRSHPQEPILILAIDDLAALLPSLDEQTYARLYWLIRHGPRYQVWTLATLPAESFTATEQLDPRFLSAFRTRLFGYMRDERLAQRLAGDDSLDPRCLSKGDQFLVPYGGEWLRFWICKLENSHSRGKA